VITESLLLAVMPRAGANAAIFTEPLRIAAERYAINTPLRVAAWLATIGHESMDLTALEENLNYSADGLARVWPGRFRGDDGKPNAKALALARHPVEIANEVYNGRMGNRPGTSDGFDFRGRGPIMITGRDYYFRAGEGTGYALQASPDLVLEPMVGALVAGWVWGADKRCNPLADSQDFENCTRRINGGTVGMEDRLARYARAKRTLAA
jgi:putative chitinase